MSLCRGSRPPLPPDMCVCPPKPLLRVFPTTLKEMGPYHSSHWCHLLSLGAGCFCSAPYQEFKRLYPHIRVQDQALIFNNI